MLRYLPIIAISLATPASAASFECVDPKAEVTLEIVETFDDATGIFGLVSSKFQIADDIGYTSETDPNNDGDVTLVNIGEDFSTLEYDFHLFNGEKGYDTTVGSVRLSRAHEGAQSAVGGTLHVAGGGAWAITCMEQK